LGLIILAAVIIAGIVDGSTGLAKRIGFSLSISFMSPLVFTYVIRFSLFITFGVLLNAEFKLPSYIIIVMFPELVMLATSICSTIVWGEVVVKYDDPSFDAGNAPDLESAPLLQKVYLILVLSIIYAVANLVVSWGVHNFSAR
jgi:hypothetical protein